MSGFAITYRPPSLLARVAHATQAAARAASAIARRQPLLVAEPERQARLAICQSCDQRRNGWCRHARCGCALTLKARLATESCPLSKWPTERPVDTCQYMS